MPVFGRDVEHFAAPKDGLEERSVDGLWKPILVNIFHVNLKKKDQHKKKEVKEAK